MKFLNHLDLVENEAKRLKMYRVPSGSYTPGINTSGNVILDTSVSSAGTAGLPKWWDSAGNSGSGIWRDFSWGTAGAGSWNIQSDSGANIAVHATDTLDLTGGVALSTTTTGSATNPVVTFDVLDYGAASSVTATTSSGDDKWYGITHHPSTGKLQVRVPWAANTNTTYSAGANMTLTGTVFSTHAATSVTTTDGTYIDLTPNSATTGAVTVTADLSATDGTAIENERVLSKSNKWITVASLTGVDVDVDNAHLLTRLAALESAGGAADQNIVIGTDPGDTIVITGNLTVSGTTTTLNTDTLAVEDNIITLNSNVSGTPALNAGLEVERGSATNVSLFFAENEDIWYAGESSTNGLAGGSNGGGLANKKIIQDGYTVFSADGGTNTTAANPDDVISILGGTNCTTAVTTDTITVNVDTDTIRSGVHAFKNIAPFNTTNSGTASSAANGVIAAEQLDDTLSVKGVDESVYISSTILTDTLMFKSAVRACSKVIDVSAMGSINRAVITHNFGNKRVIVQLWDLTTDEVLQADMIVATNAVQIDFSATPANDVVCNIMEVNINSTSTIAYPGE